MHKATIVLLGVCIGGIALASYAATGIGEDGGHEHAGERGATLYVGGTGLGNYSSIQAAVDNASSGDSVYVYNGTYTETVTINTAITLTGENPATTTIDGNMTGDVVTLNAAGVNITSLAITNSGASAAGIKVLSDTNTIAACTITGSYYGIWFYYTGDDNLVTGCTIHDNDQDGVSVFYTDDNTITASAIYNNTWWGVSLNSATGTTITNCTITANDYGGIGLTGSIATNITACTVHANDYHNIRLHTSDSNTISGCMLHNCSASLSSYAVKLWNAENNTLMFNTITDNHYGVYISDGSNSNMIFYNTLVNNTYQAYDACSNTWDNGYPGGGNHWSDHAMPDDHHGYHQNLAGFDLLVDHPYNISGGGNQDRWPHAIRDGGTKPLYVPDSLLVAFKQNVTNATINSTIATHGAEITDRLSHPDVYLVNITSDNQSEYDTLYMFRNDTHVSAVSLDLYTYPRQVKPAHLTAPNDPCYPKQWHLNNYGTNPGVPAGLIDADVDAPQAWEHITDCRQDWNGDDFVIAIIDSGVDLHHPDIMANLWTNPDDPAGDDDGDGNPDDDGNGVVDDIHGAEFSVRGRWDHFTNRWRMTYSDDGSPDDEDGHGTHCAGIICAQGNNGMGGTGVCMRAQLMVLKTGSVRVRAPHGLLNVGLQRASASLFAHCVDYIVQQKNSGVQVNVVSYSQGVSRHDVMRWYGVNENQAERIITGSGLADLYGAAIQDMHNAEILFVCAAGNNGQNIDRVDAAGAYSDYPSKLTVPNIIAVAASDNQDNIAGFSSYGNTSVDLVAPGQDILSLAMHGRYVYRSDDDTVSDGDRRLTEIASRRGIPDYASNTVVQAADSDVGDSLHGFAANEKFNDWHLPNGFDGADNIYVDNDNDGNVTSGDQRLTIKSFTGGPTYPAGSFVNAGDADVHNPPHRPRPLTAFQPNTKYSLVRYMSGTSMATPAVAGSVAHFWCQYPDLSHTDVKNWILRKVDPRQSLQDRVVSGIDNDGRLRMICGPDFGDAPDPKHHTPGRYPTTLQGNTGYGASHEDMGEEWLGWDTSPEYDSNVEPFPPYDGDLWSNLYPWRQPPNPHPPYQASMENNTDAYDDGVSLRGIGFAGGSAEIEFHIQVENPFVHDVDDGRYDEYHAPKRDEKKIFINTWFDWNKDGDWDDGGEFLLKCPAYASTWWGGPNMTCCYGQFWPDYSTFSTPSFRTFAPLLNEHAYRKTSVPLPAVDGWIWYRTRLDYGENAGVHPYPRYDSQHPFTMALIDTYAHAQYGEVEDYVMYIIRKEKEIGTPRYDDGTTLWLTDATPIELVDYPLDCPYLVWNYYRLWYDDTWTDWMLYDPDMPIHFTGEGDHGIEFYGKAKLENQTAFSETFQRYPDRWMSNDIDNTTLTWQWTNMTPGWLNESLEGSFMVLDDSLFYELPSTDSLISAPISCTVFNDTRLVFDGALRARATETLSLSISDDYGGNWTPVLTLTGNVSGPWTLNISDVADGNVIMLNVTYTDEWNHGYGAVIENVHVTGEYITYSPPHVQYHPVDMTPPTAELVPIEPYMHSDIPFPVSCVPTDLGCGVKNVSLYYRHSPDNATWSDWHHYGTGEDGTWMFTAPDAPAYYEFHTIATDHLGNMETYDGVEAMAHVPMPTFTFTLCQGWNLVTMPVNHTYTAASLGENISGCSIVAYWNATSSMFQSFLVGISPPGMDFAIRDGVGYFVYVEHDCYAGAADTPVPDVAVALSTGWNTLGWYNGTATNASASSLGTAIDNCTIVAYWNASSSVFQSFLVDVSPPAMDFRITRGMGVFVYVTSPGVWHGEG